MKKLYLLLLVPLLALAVNPGTQYFDFTNYDFGAGSVSGTELFYIDGASSNIQTQLNGKQATITGSATTVDTESLTASRAVISNASSKLAVSATTDTEIGYVSGVTSALQTQLNAKQATITGSATTIDTETLGVSLAVVTDGSGKITTATPSTTEINYLDGVTSAIQTQLGTKVTGVVGAVTDNRLVRWDGTTGYLVQEGSPAVLDDAGILTGLTGVTSSGTVTASGTLTGSGRFILSAETNDAAATGASAVITNSTTSAHYILTNASLVSVGSFSTAINGQVSIVENQTGADITILNEDAGTATATERFLTGTGNDMTLKDGAAVIAKYNNLSDRWQIIGGSGSGGIQNLNQSRIAGESYFLGTASCTPTRTSTTIGAFTADADCPGPTLIGTPSMGTWATTDSNLYRQTITNLPAGTYKATFFTVGAMSTPAVNVFAIYDGSTICDQVSGGTTSTTGTATIVTCVFNYTSSGTRNFELYAASSTGAVNVSGDAYTPNYKHKFMLEYMVNESVYASDCGTDCVDVFSAKVSSTGTVSDENIEWITGNASPAASIYPIVFKAGLFTVAPTCTISLNQNAQSVVWIHTAATTSGVSIHTYSLAGSDADRAFTIMCQKQGVDFAGSRTIVGTFENMVVSTGISKPKICEYFFGGAAATLAAPVNCTTGTCVEVFDSCGAGSAPAYSATGVYLDLTFSNGTWSNSSAIDCRCEAFDTTSNSPSDCSMYFLTSDHSWATNSSGGYVGNVYAMSNTGTAANKYVKVSCKGDAP